MELRTDPYLFPLIREPASRWERAGLTPEQERRFNLLASLLVVTFLAGWIYAIFFLDRAALDAPTAPVARITSRITQSPLAANAPPEPVFLVDQFAESFAEEFESFRGLSGELNVVIREPGDSLALPALPDTLPAGVALALQPADGEDAPADTAGLPVESSAPNPGIWNVVLRMRDAIRPVSDVNVINTVPLSERSGGRIGRYLIGRWPFESGGTPRPNYETPGGVIRVTPENRDFPVSEHFVLGDFLTKGQTNVWPKYVVLSTRLLDKLELTVQELERSGHPVENVFVVSGFRTPVYNAGGGNTQGRGNLSRHMYGDAADIAIDNDGDNRMDDLNGDGRVNVADARLVAEAAQRVEQNYSSLVGGIGIYAPTGAHAGIVHIDARGYRARWGAW